MNFWDTIFKVINGAAGQNQTMDNIMMFCSQKLPIILALLVIVVYVVGIVKHSKEARAAAVNTVVFLAINMILSAIIGNVWYAQRPFVKDPSANLLYLHKPNSSFPSDHSLASMSIALGLTAYNKVLGVVSIIISVLIGVSRVYVGHHYPEHVVGSYLIAIVTFVIYNKFFSRKVRNLYLNIEKRTPILKGIVKNK